MTKNNNVTDALEHQHRLVKCAKILGCKPEYVEFTLRDMYEKISRCDAIIN